MSNYEKKVSNILRRANIKFQTEKTFSDLKHGLFRFDFYIPNYNGSEILIEVDGEQHFKPVYGRQAFMKGQEHDRRKNSYCLAKGIPLYRIPYWEIKNLITTKDLFKQEYFVKSRWHNDELSRH